MKILGNTCRWCSSVLYLGMLNQINVRLRPEEIKRLNAIAGKLGVSQADVIRLSLRKLEQSEKIREKSRKSP